MPAARAAVTAVALLPAISRISAGGPMKVMPASTQACARSGFSERKPYPGYTASAPLSTAARMISSTSR